MKNPFDTVIDDIINRGYYNQRLPNHSNIVSEGIFNDLLEKCKNLREDFENKKVNRWYNIPTPGARERQIDLLVGQQKPDGEPDLTQLRICVENKSVITAHRNRYARYDDLNESLQVLHRAQPEAIFVATIMIGTCEKVLNVPDRIKPFYKTRMDEFESKILPRLSSGDQSLLDDFQWAVSKNRAKDPELTIDKFRTLQVRAPSLTHIVGYDYILLVPVSIDNIDPPQLVRDDTLGIDIDEDYEEMIEHVCKTYNARWHP